MFHKNNVLYQDWLALFGRFFLALIFILAGLSKIFGFEATADYVANAGLPLPEVAIVTAILVELGAGSMLLVGWQTRYAALVIAIFVVMVTFVFHLFWTFDGSEMENQLYHFLKNLCIVGGLLYVMAYGPGHYSIDAHNSTNQ